MAVETIPEGQATDVYYDVAVSKLETQMQSIDQLDVKVATVFVSASGILAIFAGLLSQASPSTNHGVWIALLVFSILVGSVYVALAAFLYRAYRTRDWDYGAKLTQLKDNSTIRDKDIVQYWVANACVKSFNDNTARITKKAQLLDKAFFAFGAEVLLLFIIGVTILLTK